MTSGQLSFSRLLNPDWSIQISGAPAVCKVTLSKKYAKQMFVKRCRLKKNQ